MSKMDQATSRIREKVEAIRKDARGMLSSFGPKRATANRLSSRTTRDRPIINSIMGIFSERPTLILEEPLVKRRSR